MYVYQKLHRYTYICIRAYSLHTSLFVIYYTFKTMSFILKRLIFICPGPRETWGENREQIRVQGVQSRIPAPQRNQPREHQVFAQQGWRAHRRGSASGNRHRREAYSDRAPVDAQSTGWIHEKTILKTPFKIPSFVYSSDRSLPAPSIQFS